MKCQEPWISVILELRSSKSGHGKVLVWLLWKWSVPEQREQPVRRRQWEWGQGRGDFRDVRLTCHYSRSWWGGWCGGRSGCCENSGARSKSPGWGPQLCPNPSSPRPLPTHSLTSHPHWGHHWAHCLQNHRKESRIIYQPLSNHRIGWDKMKVEIWLLWNLQKTVSVKNSSIQIYILWIVKLSLLSSS
jgi:hypothetical protein